MSSYDELMVGLDRLYFFSNYVDEESLADAINSFVLSSGWTWDKIIEKMAEENYYEKQNKSNN